MKKLGERLEHLQKDLSQKAFAEKIGVPLNTYTAWLRGERYPSYEAIQKICTALGVSADWLLTGREGAAPGAAPAAGAAPRPLSAADAALLGRLHGLAASAEAAYREAASAGDTAAMTVPALLLNLSALVRALADDTAALARLATLLHCVHVGIASDPAHLGLAKALLDKLAGERP